MSAIAYKRLLASGILQIIIGGSCMIFGVIEKVTDRRGTITSIPCLAIWMGLWISITGIIGAIAKGQMRGPSKAMAPGGQVMYLQPQGTSPVSYVIVQGPNGTPVAIPAQSGGPMIVSGGTRVYNQGGGAVGTSVPPHYQTTVQQIATSG